MELGTVGPSFRLSSELLDHIDDIARDTSPLNSPPRSPPTTTATHPDAPGAAQVRLHELAIRTQRPFSLIYETSLFLTILGLALSLLSCMAIGVFNLALLPTTTLTILSAILLRVTFMRVILAVPFAPSKQGSLQIYSLARTLLCACISLGVLALLRIVICFLALDAFFVDHKQLEDPQRILIQQIMSSVLANTAFIAIVFMSIFALALALFIGLIHLILAVLTCFKFSLILRLKEGVRRQWQGYLNARLKKLVPLAGHFLKDKKYKEVDEAQGEKPCSVCLEELEAGQRVYRLPCAPPAPPHLFHAGCLEPWVAKAAACPACRRQLDSL